MSYKTIEVVTCDRCGFPLAASETVEFGRPTLAQWERLSRAAVAAGWLYIPGECEYRKPVTYTTHFCPDCRPKPKKGKRR